MSETIKTPERVSAAPAWAISIAIKIANWIRYDWKSLQERRIAEKGLPQWVNGGAYQGGQLDLIDLAMSLTIPMIAERDKLNEMLSHLGALAEAERDAHVADRDRLAAEVERLKGELADMRGIADQTAADSRGNFNAACREGKRAAVAEAALQRIGMSLGSTDEWADQATMIADVEGRVAAACQTIATLRESASPFSAAVYNDNGDVTISTDHLRTEHWLALRNAIAKLDATPATTRRDAAVSRAMFRDAETGAAGGNVEDGEAELRTPYTPRITVFPQARVAEFVMRDEPTFYREVDAEMGVSEVLSMKDRTVIGMCVDLSALSDARRTIAEAVEIMRPLVTPTEHGADMETLNAEIIAAQRAGERARAFIEKHGESK